MNSYVWGLFLSAVIPTTPTYITNPWSSYEGCYKTVVYNGQMVESEKAGTISQKLSDTQLYNPQDYSRAPETQPSAHFVLTHGKEETVVDAYLTQGEYHYNREGSSYRYDGWINAGGAKPTYLSKEIHVNLERDQLFVTIWSAVEGKTQTSEWYMLARAECSSPR